jgi:hypothetical protein
MTKVIDVVDNFIDRLDKKVNLTVEPEEKEREESPKSEPSKGKEETEKKETEKKVKTTVSELEPGDVVVYKRKPTSKNKKTRGIAEVGDHEVINDTTKRIPLRIKNESLEAESQPALFEELMLEIFSWSTEKITPEKLDEFFKLEEKTITEEEKKIFYTMMSAISESEMREILEKKYTAKWTTPKENIIRVLPPFKKGDNITWEKDGKVFTGKVEQSGPYVKGKTDATIKVKSRGGEEMVVDLTKDDFIFKSYSDKDLESKLKSIFSDMKKKLFNYAESK